MSPWGSCGCSTVYTDANGNPITGAGSGADGTPVTSSCSTPWGLLALMGVVAIVAAGLTKKKRG